ncbi:MAG: [FeFe] hydrogenase H-cluster radical SAM maturase HydE [Clostridiales bacterium]|nr:[FeFe] hydrogenase H-cluster radical SAM maturase HydE [Clostridiales bacterium]MDR2749403.1 [FeFe] hydrogenase H-cluster radical SAM maturase HydE [Clostridiales bacterium]
MKELIEKLERNHGLSKEEYIRLLSGLDGEARTLLAEKATVLRKRHYGNDIYIRGLIEFTSFCKNDCLYCGLRASNKNAQRYRLSKEEILDCCQQGHELGFRTFVLQGGEDPHYTDEILVDITKTIKKDFPDCAITLSLGERSRESLAALREAGADRYLLRHETANKKHYELLHPKGMSFEKRMQQLWDMKELGYQIGCGFMVGSPGQSTECLADDLVFVQRLKPHMVGIGPFIPHKDTPFRAEPQGDLDLTLALLGIIRLILPQALIPSTTALGTIDPWGREKGVLAGANVVMPNLSPVGVRKKYMLYDNKICTGEEAAECKHCLHGRMQRIGCGIAVSRGDPAGYRLEEAALAD